MNEAQGAFRRQSGGGYGKGKGMTVTEARGICAQVQDWARLATSIDGKHVPATPTVALKRVVYAMQTLEKANQPTGIRYSTIAALICCREGRIGASVRTRRADGTIVTLSLTGGRES